MMNSDCYSAIHSWRATVATLKRNLELPSLLECLFCVNSVCYSPKFGFAESVGDALRSEDINFFYEILKFDNKCHKKKCRVNNNVNKLINYFFIFKVNTIYKKNVYKLLCPKIYITAQNNP